MSNEPLNKDELPSKPFTGVILHRLLHEEGEAVTEGDCMWTPWRQDSDLRDARICTNHNPTHVDLAITLPDSPLVRDLVRRSKVGPSAEQELVAMMQAAAVLEEAALEMDLE